MSFFTNLVQDVTHFFEGEKKEENPDDDFIEQQLNNEKHRYDSFAAVRHDCEVKSFVDGQNYCWYGIILFNIDTSFLNYL
jgi:phospholipase D1/2